MNSNPTVGINIFSPNGIGPQLGFQQVIFTTKYPFAKLDTQLGIDTSKNPVTNPISFQNISIFFKDGPPANPGGVFTQPLYKFKHGYHYIPTWWVLFQNNGGSNSSAQFSYGTEGSTILSTVEGINFISLIVNVDATYVYINLFISYLSITDPFPIIIGFTINLRVYVFVEPVLLS